MQLLANENFPKASVLALRNLGYNITAIGEDYQGVSDKTVMHIAQTEDRLILTFDKDYRELIFKHNLKPKTGVLYLRLDAYVPEEPARIVHHLLSELEIETSWRLTVFDGQTVRQRSYKPAHQS